MILSTHHDGNSQVLLHTRHLLLSSPQPMTSLSLSPFLRSGNGSSEGLSKLVQVTRGWSRGLQAGSPCWRSRLNACSGCWPHSACYWGFHILFLLLNKVYQNRALHTLVCGGDTEHKEAVETKPPAAWQRLASAPLPLTTVACRYLEGFQMFLLKRCGSLTCPTLHARRDFFCLVLQQKRKREREGEKPVEEAGYHLGIHSINSVDVVS